MNTNFNYFCDLEFTSLDPIGGDILTGTILVCKEDSPKVVDELSFKSRPTNTKYWEQEAQTVHGITWNQASNYDDPKNLVASLLAFFSKYPCDKFICHALDRSFFDSKRKSKSWAYIDYAYLEWHFQKHGNVYDLFKHVHPNKRVSTIALAKSVGHKKRKLDILCQLYKIELNHHDARSDTIACKELYYLMKQGNTLWEK